MSADVDLTEPIALRAAMVRTGIGPMHVLPYWSPDKGYVNPLDDPEVQGAVRRFIGDLWKAALRAEAAT